MGVIYKLKPEIVEHIIKLKEDQPKLSCRKLSDIAQQLFGVTISKSAINLLLKNSKLSNPVGRPTGLQPEKLFPIKKVSSKQGEINKVRKKDPSPTVEKATKSKTAEPQQKDLKPRLKDRFQLPDIPVPVSPKTSTIENQKKEIPHVPKSRRPADSMEKPPVRPSIPQPPQGMLCDGLGAVFLKAVEWDLGTTSLLGDILRRHLKGGDLVDLDAAGQLLLMLHPFGIKRLEDINQYHRQGLWVLSGLKTRIDSESLLRIINGIQDMRGLTLRLDVDIPQIFANVGFIRILLEDASEIWVDGSMASLWDDYHSLPLEVSLNKGLTVMACEWLNNSKPAILNCLPFEWMNRSHFRDFVSAMNGYEGKRIVKLQLYDDKGIQMSEFDSIPDKKRGWISQIMSWQDEYTQIIGSEEFKIIKMYPSSIFSKDTYLGRVPLGAIVNVEEGIDPTLSLIVVRNGPQAGVDRLLVTNMGPDMMNSEDVVMAYEQRWPNKDRGYAYQVVKEFRPVAETMVQEAQDRLSKRVREDGPDNLNYYISGTCAFMGLIGRILDEINRRAVKMFFPQQFIKEDINTMISIFYGISGYIEKKDKNIKVRFIIDQNNYKYLNELEFACSRLNENDITDFNGKKVVATVELR